MIGFAVLLASEGRTRTGRPQAFTRQEVEAALWKAHGSPARAARRLGCDRTTIYRYLARYPGLDARAIKEECREELKDIAEWHLFEAVQRGDWNAVRYFLSTQGKDRGYTLRPEPKEPNEGLIPPGGTTVKNDQAPEMDAFRDFLAAVDQMGGLPPGPEGLGSSVDFPAPSAQAAKVPAAK